VENASAALELINNAIDTLNEFRSDVGAAQNRLDFASSNLNISVENAEAARSTLVDLDLAQEMTSFSSKQVLMQAGVAMLAQANQMPQNLLRLLQ
jgi:flagellin